MKTKPNPGCTCLLCQPIPGKRAHPIWGYDLDEVPKQECLVCKKPIGNEPYEENRTLARFGSMSFVHTRCRHPNDSSQSTTS